MLLNLRVKSRISGLSFNVNVRDGRIQLFSLLLTTRIFGNDIRNANHCVEEGTAYLPLTAKNVLIGAGACCVSAGDQCCKCCLYSEGVFSLHLTGITCKSFLGKRLGWLGIQIHPTPGKKSTNVCIGHLKSLRAAFVLLIRSRHLLKNP